MIQYFLNEPPADSRTYSTMLEFQDMTRLPAHRRSGRPRHTLICKRKTGTDLSFLINPERALSDAIMGAERMPSLPSDTQKKDLYLDISTDVIGSRCYTREPIQSF